MGMFSSVLRQSFRMTAGLVRGRMPLTLAFIYPTLNCNLRCAYCNSSSFAGPELPTKTWLGIFDDLADLGCRHVIVVGGEPLLRPDIADILKEVKSRGMSCALNTNGRLFPRQPSWLRSLDILILSLDAAGPENDRLRGEGVFDAVRRAARTARAAGVRVKINATLTRTNLPALERLLDFATEEGLFMTCNIMRSAEAAHSRSSSDFRAEDGEVRRAVRRLAGLAGSGDRVLYSRQSYLCSSRWPDFSHDLYRAGDIDPAVLKRLGYPRCHAGQAFLAIDPEGRIAPCPLTLGRIGGGDAVQLGVARARRKAIGHDCLACHSTCMIELNSLFSLRPAVLGNLLFRQSVRFF